MSISLWITEQAVVSISKQHSHQSGYLKKCPCLLEFKNWCLSHPSWGKTMTVILHLSSCCDEAVNKKSNILKKEKKQSNAVWNPGTLSAPVSLIQYTWKRLICDLLDHNSCTENSRHYLQAKSEEKEINAGLCCLGYPSEILGDRRRSITSSMYCNFRRRRIKALFFLWRWEKGFCGLAHKVRNNSWILIAILV